MSETRDVEGLLDDPADCNDGRCYNSITMEDAAAEIRRLRSQLRDMTKEYCNTVERLELSDAALRWIANAPDAVSARHLRERAARALAPVADQTGEAATGGAKQMHPGHPLVRRAATEPEETP